MKYLVLRDIYNFAAGDDRSTIPTCIFVNTLSLWRFEGLGVYSTGV